MPDQRLTFSIDGREALPVRAIPYVTGWDRFTPVALVRYLAQDPERFTEWDKPLTAYVWRDGVPVAVAPSHWDRVLRILKSFEAQAGPVMDPSGDEAWLEHAAEKIPAGIFLWRDEFTDVYRAYCEKFDEKNKTLDLDPLLMDDATRAMVMAGLAEQMPEVSPVAAAPEKVKPVQRAEAQDAAILHEIRLQEFSPLALPKNKAGMSGVKSKIRIKLVGIDPLFPKEGKQFNKAWDRLRQFGEIADKG